MSEYVQALTPSLFWDINRETVDDEKHRRFIIGRVLERGSMQDWRRTRSHYDLPTVVQEAQRMRSLDPNAFVRRLRRLRGKGCVQMLFLATLAPGTLELLRRILGSTQFGAFRGCRSRAHAEHA